MDNTINNTIPTITSITTCKDQSSLNASPLQNIENLKNKLIKAVKKNYGFELLKKEYIQDIDIDNLYSEVFDTNTCHINFQKFSSPPATPAAPAAVAVSETQASQKKTKQRHTKRLPIKIEICSGNGDWICQQAKTDKDSLWVSIEIRADRVYKTFINAMLENVNNLLIMQGDANDVISSYIGPAMIDNFMINMPEPPQQKGANLITEASHLLTIEFFCMLSYRLKSKGYITVFTDNKWYGELLVNILYECIETITASTSSNQQQLHMKSILPSETILFPSESGLWNTCYHKNNIYLYSGTPSMECGYYDTTTSSYFDRLKKEEHHSDEKYFIVLQNY